MNDLGFASPAPVTYGPPRWMISFADLMSVILTFFVLLFSMSSPPKSNVEKENILAGTTPSAFSAKVNPTPTQIKTAKTDQNLSTSYLADIIKNRMATYPELQKARLEASDDQLVLSITASEFNDEYATNMAQVLKSLTNKSAIYSENLDQSKAVVEKLQEKGLDRNITYFESHDHVGKIDIVIYP